MSNSQLGPLSFFICFFIVIIVGLVRSRNDK